jgi:outer membrane protein assembly factor BamB
MRSTVGGTTRRTDIPYFGYQSAVNTVFIAGVFSIIFFVLLIVNYLMVSIVTPRREAILADLKVKIQNKPDDKDMLSRIRLLDVKIRQDRLRRLDLSRKSAYMLLGSTATLLVGVLWAASCRKIQPMPQPAGDERQTQIRQASYTRWSILAGMTVLFLTGGFLVLVPRLNFSQATGAVPSYPSDEEIALNWYRFRGPAGAGISPYTKISTRWDGKTGEGILWKAEVPLPGHSSPIVWGDRVFLTGATPDNRQVYCFDGSSGKLLWIGDVPTVVQTDGKKPNVGEDTSWAASTAVTDGRRVYAIFAIGDIGCFDFAGRCTWTKSLGIPDNAYGYASSLEMYQSLLLVQYDQGAAEDNKSRLLALDGSSGRLVWEAKRPVCNSWTSPILVKIGDKYQVITVSDPWVISYEPAKGAEIWRAKCVGGDIAPSPVFAGGLVVTMEPYSHLVAIRPDGHTDVTKTHIAWRTEDGAPDICSPVSNGELVFVLFSEGTLECYRLADGKQVYEKDLDGSFRASPSLVGDRLYLLSEKGIMFIAEAGTEYREIARCELGEDCSASPAFADGKMYLRGAKNLYCIGNKP